MGRDVSLSGNRRGVRLEGCCTKERVLLRGRLLKKKIEEAAFPGEDFM